MTFETYCCIASYTLDTTTQVIWIITADLLDCQGVWASIWTDWLMSSIYIHTNDKKSAVHDPPADFWGLKHILWSESRVFWHPLQLLHTHTQASGNENDISFFSAIAQARPSHSAWDCISSERQTEILRVKRDRERETPCSLCWRGACMYVCVTCYIMQGEISVNSLCMILIYLFPFFLHFSHTTNRILRVTVMQAHEHIWSPCINTSFKFVAVLEFAQNEY